MVFFHKVACSVESFCPEHLNSNEIEHIYTACLFLATKVCNKLISVNKLARSFFVIIKKMTEKMISTDLQLPKSEIQANLQDFISKVLAKELEILHVINFDISCDLPYLFVEKMRNYFSDFTGKDKIIDSIYNFINDSFITPVILYFSPLKITLAAIYLLSVHLKKNLPDRNGVKWYKIIDLEIELEEIKEISSIIWLIYSPPKSKKDKELSSLDNFCKELSVKEINLFLGKRGNLRVYLNFPRKKRQKSQKKKRTKLKQRPPIKLMKPQKKLMKLQLLMN